MAYLRFIKSNDNVYVYLKEYKKQEYKTDNSYTLFAFGRLDKAINFINVLLSDYDNLKNILIDDDDVVNNFTKRDWESWKREIEKRYSKIKQKREVF